MRADAAAPAAPAAGTAGVPFAPKAAEVAERIREMIVRDELPPGAPIRERSLAERLNVSRTPMREALRILSAEGLVEIAPHRGASVAAPDDEQVRALLELLGVLEAFAGELACRHASDAELTELRAKHYEMQAAFVRGDWLGYFRLNQEIHLDIVRYARNGPLAEHHRLVNARVYRVRFVCTHRTERWARAIREHEAMLEALERRDPAALASVLRHHVVQAWEDMRQMLSEENGRIDARKGEDA